LGPLGACQRSAGCIFAELLQKARPTAACRFVRGAHVPI